MGGIHRPPTTREGSGSSVVNQVDDDFDAGDRRQLKMMPVPVAVVPRVAELPSLEHTAPFASRAERENDEGREASRFLFHEGARTEFSQISQKERVDEARWTDRQRTENDCSERGGGREGIIIISCSGGLCCGSKRQRS